MIAPIDRIKLFGATEWEEFVVEWAHSLKCSYADVRRLGGAGDQGRDVIGIADDGSWDNYQCKHYAQPLAPSQVWTEIGKLSTTHTSAPSRPRASTSSSRRRALAPRSPIAFASPNASEKASSKTGQPTARPRSPRRQAFSLTTSSAPTSTHSTSRYSGLSRRIGSSTATSRHAGTSRASAGAYRRDRRPSYRPLRPRPRRHRTCVPSSTPTPTTSDSQSRPLTTCPTRVRSAGNTRHKTRRAKRRLPYGRGMIMWVTHVADSRSMCG